MFLLQIQCHLLSYEFGYFSELPKLIQGQKDLITTHQAARFSERPEFRFASPKDKVSIVRD